MPSVKEKVQDLPGAQGVLDLTEANGTVYYNRRENIEIVLELMDDSYQVWLARYSEITDLLVVVILISFSTRITPVRKLNGSHSQSSALVLTSYLKGSAVPVRTNWDSTGSLFVLSRFRRTM